MTNVEDIIKEITDPITEKDRDLIVRAYNMAERAHSSQKRMNGDPYFIHVFETAKILAKLRMDAETIAAGLLHDTLEDTETTEEEIRKEFGDEILFLIQGVTKLGTLKYRGQERHVESLRKFFIAMAQDLRVVIIKFADRLHNLRTLEFVREDKRARIALESIQVYAPLADRLGMGKLKGEIEDTAFPFAYPDAYRKVEELIKERKEKYEAYLSEITTTLQKELDENNIKAVEISYRLKHKYSLYKKLLRYDMDIDKIYDIVALRVIVKNVEECYRVLGLVHSLWNPLPGRIKDYIAVPKPNGYRSIHTTIFTGGGGIAEIQIRTEDMHAEAAYGVAAHSVYKEHGSVKINDKKSKFKWIEELKELNLSPEDPRNFIDHLKTDFFSHRIFVFTPKGDVLDLPDESTPIDFAYSIHSDIGNHTFGAKVNGKLVELSTKLQNGDIVEIMDKKDSKPNAKWLDFAKTTVAKKHIKQYLEKNSLLARLKSFGQR